MARDACRLHQEMLLVLEGNADSPMSQVTSACRDDHPEVVSERSWSWLSADAQDRDALEVFVCPPVE
jgi:hypothetical protein